MNHREATLANLLPDLDVVHADLADTWNRGQSTRGRRHLCGSAGERCEVGLNELFAHRFDLIVQESGLSLLFFKLILEMGDTGIAGRGSHRSLHGRSRLVRSKVHPVTVIASLCGSAIVVALISHIEGSRSDLEP